MTCNSVTFHFISCHALPFWSIISHCMSVNPHLLALNLCGHRPPYRYGLSPRHGLSPRAVPPHACAPAPARAVIHVDVSRPEQHCTVSTTPHSRQHYILAIFDHRDYSVLCAMFEWTHIVCVVIPCVSGGDRCVWRCYLCLGAAPGIRG